MIAARALVLASLAVALPAAADTRDFELVGCPDGYTPQWRAVELEDAIAPYHALPGDVFVEPRTLPAPRFARAARRDPEFPRAGKAYAILLVNERGRVDDVLVHCATSARLAAPIIAAWRGKRVGVATRDGKPVRTAFTAPVAFGD